LDYDENTNIGNWQWWASVWADPRPLRIFNPSLQSERFDRKCEYIRKYIPILKVQPEKAIHNPLIYKLDYFEPIVNHNERQKLTKLLYKN
jgi:deoxyribodipyrimidine photo-lyase